jgi:hypothetical protein
VVSESKVRHVLKHHNGRYLSWDSKNFPLTHLISEARQFYQPEQIPEFLLNSYYRPEIYDLDSSDFEVVEVEISYRELESNEPISEDR